MGLDLSSLADLDGKHHVSSAASFHHQIKHRFCRRFSPTGFHALVEKQRRRFRESAAKRLKAAGGVLWFLKAERNPGCRPTWRQSRQKVSFWLKKSLFLVKKNTPPKMEAAPPSLVLCSAQPRSPAPGHSPSSQALGDVSRVCTHKPSSFLSLCSGAAGEAPTHIPRSENNTHTVPVPWMGRMRRDT